MKDLQKPTEGGICPDREYITITHHLSDGNKMFCDSALLPWYHKWHVKFRLWVAKKLVKSCMRFAKPIVVKTFTGTVDLPESPQRGNGVKE